MHFNLKNLNFLIYVVCTMTYDPHKKNRFKSECLDGKTHLISLLNLKKQETKNISIYKIYIIYFSFEILDRSLR